VKQRMASELAPEAYGAVAELERRVSEFGIDGALYERRIWGSISLHTSTVTVWE
jgi:hypothetical protein